MLSLIIGVFAVIIGSIIGRRISRKTDINLSWISGVVLISLAIIKII